MAPESREDAFSSKFGQNNRVTGGAVVVVDMERWSTLVWMFELEVLSHYPGMFLYSTAQKFVLNQLQLTCLPKENVVAIATSFPMITRMN